MALNRVKGLLSGALTAVTVLSTIPAANVLAAEPQAPVIDVVSQYNLDLVKYGPELLRSTVPGFDDMDPVRFEAVKELYLDRNYSIFNTTSEITYDPDGQALSKYENTYDPATGLIYMEPYKYLNIPGSIHMSMTQMAKRPEKTATMVTAYWSVIVFTNMIAMAIQQVINIIMPKASCRIIAFMITLTMTMEIKRRMIINTTS